MTKIEWTKNLDGTQGKTLDVTGGCTKCSVGCQNCWGVREVHRLANNPLMGDKWKGLVTPDGKNWTGKIKLFPEMLERPLRCKKPTTYFVNSKSDLFHEAVPFEFIDKVFEIIRKCPQHIFQVLTKRPKQMENWALRFFVSRHRRIPKNVWLGVSVENNDNLWRIAVLTQIPAAIRYISFEPLLENIVKGRSKPFMPFPCSIEPHPIDWVIIGCESLAGGKAGRFCEDEEKWWKAARDIIEQCKVAGVLVFMKQGPINGKVEHDIKKFPKDLQLRQMPKGE